MKRASSGFKAEINKEVQRIDRESRLSEYLTEKSFLNENQVVKPSPESKEFNTETTSSKKTVETDEQSQ